MTQNGTFGGNMELVAFAKLKQIDIKVYQPGMIYVINGKDDDEDNNNISEGEEVAIRQHILHIAYHSWEHYDSVRNIDRPHTGLPEIKTSLSEHKETASDEAERGEDEEEYKNMSSVEKVVRNACPDISIYKIRRLLVKYKGNPDKVIDAIYELENNKIGKDIAIETSKEDKSLTADREEDETTVTKTEQFKTADLDQEKVDKTDISISTNKVNDMKLEFEIIESTTSALTKDILPEQILADQQQQNSTEIIVEGAEKEAEKQKQEGDKKGGSQAGTKDENHLEQNAAKKPSASERKREKKKKQKEQKLLKERAKAARKAQYTKKKEEIDSVLADSVNDNTSQVKTTAMKVVSI
ncbi:hypothetical protein BDF20DRAFT_453495 [Mycotypha africana]|uniref:uncharacterized protein n=1 Tax=Mycotypha africana TaxID=64632 RepID=UPI00230093B7|nr:uncharacterized protein BDF20DRAFT_453495 [Mycotypha africana]KAI8982144.1 hypothetical protein BDF20DRAFT_453495 [Mycotypha africana]